MADKNNSTPKPAPPANPAPKPVVLQPMAELHQMSNKPTNIKKKKK